MTRAQIQALELTLQPGLEDEEKAEALTKMLDEKIKIAKIHGIPKNRTRDFVKSMLLDAIRKEQASNER